MRKSNSIQRRLRETAYRYSTHESAYRRNLIWMIALERRKTNVRLEICGMIC